jgi:hypothetical protein
MNKSSEIRGLLKSFGKGDIFQSLFFTAEVVSAEDEKCSVKMGTTTLSDVRTGAVIDGEANNLRIKPTVGSMVLVADLSGGGMSDLAVIGFSKIDTITINGGELGGLVKIQKLEDNLNSLKTMIESIHAALPSAFTAIGAAAAAAGAAGATAYTQAMAGKSISIVDMEDEKIKH